jgi:hypothetical protein
MNAEAIKRMVDDNIEENVAMLGDMISLYEHERKNELEKLLVVNPKVVKEVAFNVLVVYTLLSYREDEMELKNAQKALSKVCETEPLAKELVAVYLQTITIEDINPNLKKPEIKNKKLVNILTSF